MTPLEEEAEKVAEQRRALAPALVAALADLTIVATGRTANAGSYSYEYADIGDVVKLTRPVLAAHGIVALTPIHDHGTGLACTVRLVHTSGESMDLGPFPFPHGRDAQATGSMVTYHRRYALVAALGIAAGDDDDGAGAHERTSTAAPLPLHPSAMKSLKDKCDEHDLSLAEIVREATGGRTDNPDDLLASDRDAIKAALDLALPAVPVDDGGEG